MFERFPVKRPGATRVTLWERVVGGEAFAMGTGAFLGHLLAPNRVADHYHWPRARWYQREIGAFNAGLAVGVAMYATGRREEAFASSWSVAATLLTATRAAAWLRGDRKTRANAVLVAEDAVLAAGGAILLAFGHHRATTGPNYTLAAISTLHTPSYQWDAHTWPAKRPHPSAAGKRD